jgi:hypothetical protein
MAAAALVNSARYDPSIVATQYEALFQEISDEKKPRRLALPRRSHEPATVLGPAPSVSRPTLDWDGAAPLPDDVALFPSDAGVAFVRRTDGTPLQAGLRDTRALLDGPIGPRIQLPFRSSDGTFAVRIWDQPIYAEVGDVDADTDGIHLTGRLHGALFDDPVLEAVSGDTVRPLAVTTDGLTFRATIPALPPGTWSLRLRHAATAEPVILGRFRDDIVDKRTAFVLPPARSGGVTLQPSYTESNEFSIRVRS